MLEHSCFGCGCETGIVKKLDLYVRLYRFAYERPSSCVWASASFHVGRRAWWVADSWADRRSCWIWSIPGVCNKNVVELNCVFLISETWWSFFEISTSHTFSLATPERCRLFNSTRRPTGSLRSVAWPSSYILPCLISRPPTAFISRSRDLFTVLPQNLWMLGWME